MLSIYLRKISFLKNRKFGENRSVPTSNSSKYWEYCPYLRGYENGARSRPPTRIQHAKPMVKKSRPRLLGRSVYRRNRRFDSLSPKESYLFLFFQQGKEALHRSSLLLRFHPDLWFRNKRTSH